MTKPVFLLSVEQALGGLFVIEAKEKLEAAGYVVVPHTGPNMILMAPTSDARTLLAGMAMQGLLAAAPPNYNGALLTASAVAAADQLLKELAK